VIGFLGFKHEFIGFLIIALISVGLVFNAYGFKDELLNIKEKFVKIL
ncbi:TPA_asm: hypothetical protein GYV19_03840, partial [Listeria monocytogenes]|nr:hypothetical protein [Listeria monocytogenes]